MEYSVIQLIFQAGYVIKVVIAILIFFSVVSWTIIFHKWRYLTKAEKETYKFRRIYNKTQSPKDLLSPSKMLIFSPLSNVFKFVYSEKIYAERDELKRMTRRYSTLEAEKLQSYLSFLATTGSATPYIGLFGTVWGIMTAFSGIGAAGSATLAVVAPGIAEALVATAIALATAIPAVIAYNYYLSRTNRMIIEAEDFSEELVDYIFTQ